MQVRQRYILAVAIRATLVIPLAWVLTGCRARPVEWPELGQEKSSVRARGTSALRIEPVSSREVADLTPDDMVQITRRIGFTDQQILDLGPNLRSALLLSGAARVIYKDKVEAVLRIQGEYVLIYSSSRGSHMYNLARGGFGVIGPAGSSR